MNTNPKCLLCTTHLEVDDTYDMEVGDSEVILHQVGHCPLCGKEYQWEDVATIIHWESKNLKEE